MCKFITITCTHITCKLSVYNIHCCRTLLTSGDKLLLVFRADRYLLQGGVLKHSNMQNVKNFLQSKALGVAEYMVPILKVRQYLGLVERAGFLPQISRPRLALLSQCSLTESLTD